MASRDSPAPPTPHLLALKVLRSTRPSLVPHALHEQSYEDGAGSGAFRQLERERGGVDGPGGGGGMLKVPAEFGTIYLGETFSAVLSLSNDLIPADASSPALLAQNPTLKVEMHTALNPQTGQPTNKHLLVTVPTPGGLAPGGSTEATVAHELKELGQHALVCTVQYSQPEAAPGEEARLVSRSFRKVYKFAVASPLSVRTKAHSPPPSCASSYLSPSQRSLIFLEVQVHNHHNHSLFFERMKFEPLLPPQQSGAEPVLTLAEGFSDPNEGLFDDEADALLPPGGVRQFLYVLHQSEEERKRAVPGANQGLGRLDIVWRTPYGEIGRLQSSTLGRRIPSLAPPTTSTAAPPTTLVGGPSPALPPLPLMSPAQPSTGPAPYRSSLSRSSTPQPEAGFTSSAPPPLRLPNADGIEFDFLVDDVPASTADEIVVDRPFTFTFRLAVSSLLPPQPSVDPSAPPPPPAAPRRKRRLHLAAQHVQYAPPLLGAPAGLPPPAASSSTRPTHDAQPSVSLTLPGAFSATAVPPPAGGVTTLQQQQQLLASQGGRTSIESLASASSTGTGVTFAPSSPSPAAPAPKLGSIRLPPPFPLSSPTTPMRAAAALPSADVVRLGPGVVDLGWVTLPPTTAGEAGEVGGKEELRWKMRFVARGEGLKRVGGMRVLLIDAVEGEEEDGADEVRGTEGEGEKAARIVGEWDVVGEVWVGNGT